ncbi:uncharacterized protein BO72DRAFT_498613 [Aspergillus fijiensis CBS 313.89]|uniref:Uncharacterized protein n=1 Tax=Aspergillus fijiensis CBS 313.89 TaxID=1448319 RepID=A0A8G1RQS0_9EURO|nr:uncharacterized protein BO72DRAFT_498613 [Aspergillus fijiensis CBS 313.89]RAK74976.1 hypothetical protein BO72DRAFT_498613 [Aspergillus fijiensis CBS 313.89]
MKASIISLSLLGLLCAGVGLAVPVDDVADAPAEVDGDASIQEILRGANLQQRDAAVHCAEAPGKRLSRSVPQQPPLWGETYLQPRHHPAHSCL